MARPYHRSSSYQRRRHRMVQDGTWAKSKSNLDMPDRSTDPAAYQRERKRRIKDGTWVRITHKAKP